MNIIHEDKHELQIAVMWAVKRFLEEDPGLLKLDVHEQAISHRIAVYLESSIEELESRSLIIDCEYSKHLDDFKYWDLNTIRTQDFVSCGCKACTAILDPDPLRKSRAGRGIGERHFRPDIILHQRKVDENNLLAIEIKKDKLCGFDIEKLKTLTRAKMGGGQY